MLDQHPDYEAMKSVIRQFNGSRDHAECSLLIRQVLAAGGVEATVSTMGPIAASPLTTSPYTCPHGTAYWAEPTAEQIMDWRRRRVR